MVFLDEGPCRHHMFVRHALMRWLIRAQKDPRRARWFFCRSSFEGNRDPNISASIATCMDKLLPSVAGLDNRPWAMTTIVVVVGVVATGLMVDTTVTPRLSPG